MRARCLTAGLIAVVCGAALLAAARPAAAAQAAPRATWTVAIYANGDNDLMYTWPLFTRPALRGIPASARVNVVVMLDTPRRDGAWLYRISGAHVGLVKHFPVERDFGAPATFTWFLRQVHERFPSDHLLVDGWDHGYGWHYFSWDATSRRELTLPGLTGAIVRSGVHIDVLAFDACNMADEDVADALAATGRVDYLVGSEDEIDQDGYPYANMFTPLAADPAQSPATVVGDMLAGWQRYYGSRRNFNWVTLSGIDLARVRAMKPDLWRWTSRLRAGLAHYAPRYRSDMHHSLYAWESWQLDLGDFAAALAGDGLIADAPLRAASAPPGGRSARPTA